MGLYRPHYAHFQERASQLTMEYNALLEDSYAEPQALGNVDKEISEVASAKVWIKPRDINLFGGKLNQ